MKFKVDDKLIYRYDEGENSDVVLVDRTQYVLRMANGSLWAASFMYVENYYTLKTEFFEVDKTYRYRSNKFSWRYTVTDVKSVPEEKSGTKGGLHALVLVTQTDGIQYYTVLTNNHFVDMEEVK